jgi:hypothetical protein
MVIKTKLLPKSVLAMALWPFILVNANKELTASTLRHEKIHLRQQVELLLVFFYLWYGIEYLIRLVMYRGDTDKAYRNISFEREAYANDHVKGYLGFRAPYFFTLYLL